MKYRCDDCGYEADEGDFDDATDINQRIDDGGIYTSKECPKMDCGALAYPTPHPYIPTEHLAKLRGYASDYLAGELSLTRFQDAIAEASAVLSGAEA